MGDFHKFDGIPRLVELKTRDRAEATRILKYGRIHDGQSVSDALATVRHKLGQNGPQAKPTTRTDW